MAKYTEYILKFLEGTLSPIEQEKFKQEIKINKELRDEFIIHQKINRFLLADGLNTENEVQGLNATALQVNKSLEEERNVNPQNIKLIEEFIKISRKTKKTKIKFKYKKSFLYSAAAVLLIFLVSSAILIISKNKKSPNELYSDYYTIFSTYNYSTRDEFSQGSSLSEALSFYEQKKYTEAIQLFSILQNTKEYSEEALFFSGLSYMELTDFTNAIKYLKLSIERKGKFLIESHWYLGLAYLKKNEPDNAKKEMEYMSKITSKYQVAAKNLMEEL